MGDVGTVRVALFKGNGHFGTGNQRQVQAVGVAGVRASQAQPEAFFTGFPAVAIEQEVDLVAPFDIDIAVGVVLLRAGDAGRDGAGDLRFVVQRWTKAHRFRVGNGFKTDFKTAIARSAGGQSGDDRARCKGLRRAA
ncbi:hypothetical protein D3C85_853330 [compost metagenome]